MTDELFVEDDATLTLGNLPGMGDQWPQAQNPIDKDVTKSLGLHSLADGFNCELPLILDAARTQGLEELNEQLDFLINRKYFCLFSSLGEQGMTAIVNLLYGLETAGLLKFASIKIISGRNITTMMASIKSGKPMFGYPNPSNPYDTVEYNTRLGSACAEISTALRTGGKVEFKIRSVTSQ